MDLDLIEDFYLKILKYGVLRIFPQKNSYFSYLKVLGKELNKKFKKNIIPQSSSKEVALRYQQKFS